MVLKPAGGLSQRKMKHVTFGSVTILQVPRRQEFTLPTPMESQASRELPLLASPTLEEVNESQGMGIMTQDSESSLPLTQAASIYSLDSQNDLSPVPFGRRDEEDDDQYLPPAACTHAVISPTQAMLSLGTGPQCACDTLPYTSLNCSAPIDKASEILGGSPFSLSPDFSFISLKRNKRNEDDAMAAAGFTRCRSEKDAAPPATCVFCHGANGVLNHYEDHYFHLGCALWCPEVYYDTQEAKLKNIDAVLKRCRDIKCAYCRQLGAPIGCVNSRCQRSYHLRCAVGAGAFLDEKKFELFCPKHRNRRDQT
ncbi:hypothetical protein BCY84_14420 [Trypanosoma cruzi cruzi]|nr:hypothetical protein BCY84_14420 [Trypanosoma cruzi cruzi]